MLTSSEQLDLQLPTYRTVYVIIIPCTAATVANFSFSARGTLTSSDSLDGQVESDKCCPSSGNADLQHPPQRAERSPAVCDCLEHT